jgi:hypothetical protein
MMFASAIAIPVDLSIALLLSIFSEVDPRAKTFEIAKRPYLLDSFADEAGPLLFRNSCRHLWLASFSSSHLAPGARLDHKNQLQIA